MSVIAFDIPGFRAAFPAFPEPGLNVSGFSDETLTMYFGFASLYISNVNYGWINGNTREYGLWLMTAHLTALSQQVAAGEDGGVITGSTVDKVSVSLQAPPINDSWDYWLNLTPYGQQYLAFLKVQSTGGLYLGGRPEKVAFRKVYGAF